MNDIAENRKQNKVQGTIRHNKTKSIYKDVFETVSANLFIIGAYFLGYHQYSFLYITIPSVLSLLPKAISYGCEERYFRTRKKDNYALENDSTLETAEWINQFLNHFWPLLDDIAQSWLTKKLHRIGLKVLKNDKHRFRINNATWGSIPPKISDIKFSNTSTDSSKTSMSIDVNLYHESDSSIELSYSSISTIVRKISWKGIARIIMRPIPASHPNSGFEFLDISFIDDPDVNFEIGGLASVLTSLGLVDVNRIVSKFLGRIKLVIKFIGNSNQKQSKPFIELRNKSSRTNYGIQKLVENTSDVILETTELSISKNHNSTAVKWFKRKDDIDSISPVLHTQNDDAGHSIGKIKLGLKYLSENEDLHVIIYEGMGLKRPTSLDPPDVQVVLTLGKHPKEVNLFMVVLTVVESNISIYQLTSTIFKYNHFISIFIVG